MSLQLGKLCELVPEDVLGPNACLFFFPRKRLKAKNLMYIKQILYLLERFVAMLGGKQAVPPPVGACGLRALPPRSPHRLQGGLLRLGVGTS